MTLFERLKHLQRKEDIPQLGNEEWVAGLAFMVDITTHLSSLNCSLQGNNKRCQDLYSTASAFIKKLCLWKTQLASGVTTHFPTLANHKINESFNVYNILICNWIDEFERRINEINSFLPVMKMYANPMTINATNAPDNIQLELLDIESDVELRQAFQSEILLGFWS